MGESLAYILWFIKIGEAPFFRVSELISPNAAVNRFSVRLCAQGRWLWTRTIGSTLIGEGLDTVIFISIAFWGIIPPLLMLTAMLTQ
jgi:hypothetical protein